MTTATPLKLGFAMDGMEACIADLVLGVCDRFERPTYVEIGVGHGGTLVGLSTVLSENSKDWRSIGLELPEGYSFNKNAVRDNARKCGLGADFIHGLPPQSKINPAWNQITIILDNAQVTLAEHWQEEIHLALIDGCHGRRCATMDFLLLEPFIASGGVVMFHDFGKDQIGQPQLHCELLDVRGACEDLGLLNDSRPHWRFNSTLVGNKSAGSGDMGVFQKT